MNATPIKIVALMLLAAASVTCGPSSGEPTPTPDTRDHMQIILDLADQLHAALQDAERRGIIEDTDMDDVVGLFANRARPTSQLIGRLVEASDNLITIRTFVSLDDTRYLSGDLYTFTIGPDTKVLRGSKAISPSSFMRDEIMRVVAFSGIVPDQVVTADRAVGYGVRAP